MGILNLAVSRWPPRSFGISAAVLIGLLGAGTPKTAQGEVKVEGTVAAVRVATTQDTIAGVLSAFATTFDVRYRTSVPLDRVLSGSYTGSLRQVISRLLDEYNYVIKNEGETTEIIIVGTIGERSIPVQAPPRPMPQGITAQWR
jgi:hypothetical protein